MKIRATASEIARHRLPVDPWRLFETEHDADSIGLTETLFGVGNGYIGMRANPPEGREAHTHGTYINGFHETWEIQHAESAHAFAKTGQTIVNVPDAKLMKLYVDDEPLLLADADLESYERAIDFRSGQLHRELVWRTPGGKRIKVRSEVMVSLTQRHLAVLRLEITPLDAAAPIVVSSQMLNRQDGEDEYHVSAAALGEGSDPRKARKFDRRVLDPMLQRHNDSFGDGGEVTLGYRCAQSRMTLSCGYRHEVDTNCVYRTSTDVGVDHAKTAFTFDGRPGETIAITKYLTYHTSNGIPAEELADRCHRSLDRAATIGVGSLQIEQERWLHEFWSHADVQIAGDEAAQQAVRWNLFQLAQASAGTQENGIAAKGVTAGGYDGHYFWDTEVYVLPFLAYTNPEAARKLLRFRWHMLDDARARAAELSQKGALYPWRTINGEEASAYYAAGTAQYHINAAVAYALEQYVRATDDREFLDHEGAEILVETARLWEDLGFYQASSDDDGPGRFHIHAVTGPDEYTTVVNDNLYTNVMARFNMRFAVRVLRRLQDSNPNAYAALVRATDLGDDEVDAWDKAAEAMFLPYDKESGINPQDANFLDRERWDFATTPSDKYPLLLNFHPLVIYRHQVLKQADVVLAMFLRGQHFSQEQKRRNFDYYDALTTGDSSLSACVQAIAATEVGHHDLAIDYFNQALYLDLANTHANTNDGVHIANAGGVWAGLVYGFAGMRHYQGLLRFAPNLPKGWASIRFRLIHHDQDIEVTIDAAGAHLELRTDGSVPVLVGETTVELTKASTLHIPVD